MGCAASATTQSSVASPAHRLSVALDPPPLASDGGSGRLKLGSGPAEKKTEAIAGAKRANPECNTLAANGLPLGSPTLTSCASDPEAPGAPLPPDEEQRLATMKRLKVDTDTGSEKRFDEMTKLCCLIFKVPICLVSLVTSDIQWFKSVQGLDTRATSRRSSFCAWTLLPACPELLVVPNALEDVRFRTNVLVVGPPNIRFYAGCPLIASGGQRLGSLCLIDNKPRDNFDAEAGTMLANFAELVVRELERDFMLEASAKARAALSEEKTQLIRAMNCFSEAIMLCEMSQPHDWQILFMNEATEKATGLTKEQAQSFWKLFKVKGSEAAVATAREGYTAAVAANQNFKLSVVGLLPGMPHESYTIQFRSATTGNLDSNMPLIGIPSTVQAAPGPGTGPSSFYYYATVTPVRASSPMTTVGSNALAGSGGSFKLFILQDVKLDPFEDVKLGPMLGRGAFGRVYRGQWNNACVAVKVLEHDGSQGCENIEALLSATISHPNVVQTFKHCSRAMPGTASMPDAEEGHQLWETWIVMEFCNKGTLSDAVDRGWFRQKGSLFEVDYAVILRTAKEVASALAYLHSCNILHGDITGQNIMLTSSDASNNGSFVVKVADFGFSRVLEAAGPIKTKTHGTISHTPPELLLEGTLTKSADVYAFGMIMWEMYMGTRPFMGLTQAQIIHHISSRRVMSLGESCPPPLRKLIAACCNAKYQERPTFAQLLVELDELAEELC